MTTCPTCHTPAPTGATECPSCAAPLLALPPGTRLYQQYRLERPLRRDHHLRYLATDERDQPVLIDEYLPAGSRRLGPLAILPPGHDAARATWTHQAASARPGPGRRAVQRTFEQNGTTYAVLTPPDGPTLRADVQRRGRWLPGDVHTLLEQLRPTLAAHGAAAGLVTPDTLTLTPDGPLLDLTATPPAEPYLPPEHLRGEPTDTWPAVAYSLGATLAFALSGQDPPGPALRALGLPLPTPPLGTPDTLSRTLTACLSLDAAARPFPHDLSGTVGPAAPTPGASTVQTVQVHGSWVTHVLLHGKQVISAGADQSVRVTSVMGEAQQRLDGLRGPPTGLVLRPEGLVAADAAGWVHLWRGHQLSSAPGPEGTTHMTAHGDEQVLTVSSSMNLTLWNVSPPRPLGHQPAGPDMITAVLTMPNRTIVIGTARGALLGFPPGQTTPTPLWPPDQFGSVQALSTDGTHLYVARGSDVVRVGHRPPLVTLDVPVTALQALPDGRIVIAGGRRLLLLDGGILTELHTAGHDLHCLAANLDWIAAGTQSGELILTRLSEPSGAPTSAAPPTQA